MDRLDVTNEKSYYSIELNKILRKYINRQRYGDFSVLIEDIFQRRAYEYGFSDTEMEAQAINLIENLEKIEFVSNEECDCFGEYCPENKMIVLNQDYFMQLLNENGLENFSDEIYETLTHEVYHAIVEGDEERGLEYYNYEKETWEGGALDEIVTEVAADRTTISRTSQDAERYRTNTQGYPTVTFAINLIAASLGSSEKETLKNGIKNRTTFERFFASRFSKTEYAQYARSTIFNKFESSLDVVYNISSGNDKNDYTQSLENYTEIGESIEQTFSSSLTSLFESTYDLTSFQITTDKEKKPSVKYVSELTYRFAKLERIMHDTLDMFQQNGFLNTEDRRKLEFDIQKSRKDLADRINQIDTVVSNEYKFENNEIYNRQFELAKIGILSQNEAMLNQKYGIEIKQDSIRYTESITEDLEYTGYVLEEDFDNGKYWDNKPAGIILKRILDKHLQLENQFDKDTTELEIIESDGNITTELEVVGYNGELPKDNKISSMLKKAKQRLGIFVTNLKNRNLLKLNSPREERKEDNSQYYASLASMKVENQFDKRYRMDPQKIITNKKQSIEVEEIITNDGKNNVERQDQK